MTKAVLSGFPIGAAPAERDRTYRLSYPILTRGILPIFSSQLPPS
jgi:hypothetical protein